ncbi:protein angel homolog 2 isoform X3 [Alosa pseudoharengus]|uniref:protein angel homolog 2 isoform X3 n=1 Tax=Alosa pseudoharengus TaxID=34774 RepID=UPI003F893B37
MSYNILSQKLLHDNVHLYKHCSLPILKWNYRLRNIMKEIQRHNADILCLQEVQEDHYETQVKPSLESLGYHCEYKKRTGNKVDGCAVVFKQASFSLVSCHPVEYFKPDIPLLDRDNVGLVLLLKPKLEKGSIRSGEGSRINRSCIEHSLNLTSAYSHHSSKRGRPEITTRGHSRRAMTVDYIFYSPTSRDTSLNSESDGLQLLARLALFDEIDLHTISGLPNANNSSDHLPLLACFRMPNLQASCEYENRF